MSKQTPSGFPYIPVVAGLASVTALGIGVAINWSTPEPDSPQHSQPTPVTASNSTNVSIQARGETFSSNNSNQEEDKTVIKNQLLEDFAPKSTPRAQPNTAEEEIHALASAESPKSERLQKLRGYLRRNYDEDVRQLAVGYLMAMVEDHEYVDVLADELRNASQPEEVLEALGNDIHDRDHRVMLPMMFELANSPSHPLREHAQNTLQVYLADSYSASPSRLRTAISDYLADYSE